MSIARFAANAGLRMANTGRCMANAGRRMANAGRRMANAGRRMANAGRRMASPLLGDGDFAHLLHGFAHGLEGGIDIALVDDHRWLQSNDIAP